jgi:hypothetical protein
VLGVRPQANLLFHPIFYRFPEQTQGDTVEASIANILSQQNAAWKIIISRFDTEANFTLRDSDNDKD